MERMNMTCRKCAGLGHTDQTLIPIDNGTGVKLENKTCDKCNGTGYTEYAVFSIEEAKAILKHCGLTTES